MLESEDKVSISLSKSLYKKIKEKIEGSGAFNSVEDYVEFVLEELLKEEEEETPFTPEEEEEIKKRLRALGYI